LNNRAARKAESTLGCDLKLPAQGSAIYPREPPLGKILAGSVKILPKGSGKVTENLHLA
jgi:hypothetical protein